MDKMDEAAPINEELPDPYEAQVTSPTLAGAGVVQKICVHCGKPATRDWDMNFCADGNVKRRLDLCDDCDLDLNEYLLHFFRVPAAEEKLEAYRRQLLGERDSDTDSGTDNPKLSEFGAEGEPRGD